MLQVSGLVSLSTESRSISASLDMSLVATQLDAAMVERAEVFAAALSELAAAARPAGGATAPRRSPPADALAPTAPPLKAAAFKLELSLHMAGCQASLRSYGRPVLCASLGQLYLKASRSSGSPATSISALTAPPSLEVRGGCRSINIRDRLCANPLFATPLAAYPANDNPATCCLEFVYEKAWVFVPASPSEGTRAAADADKDDGTDGARTTSNSSSDRAGSYVPLIALRLSLDRLHAVILCRFFMDVGHVVSCFASASRRLMQAYSASTGSSNIPARPPSKAHGASAPGGRRVTRIVLTNLTVDVPRSSASNEFYTVGADTLELLLPVSAAAMARLRESQHSQPPHTPATPSPAAPNKVWPVCALKHCPQQFIHCFPSFAHTHP